MGFKEKPRAFRVQGFECTWRFLSGERHDDSQPDQNPSTGPRQRGLYSEKTASQAGSKLAKDPDVLAEVGRRLKQKQASSSEVKPSRKVKAEQPQEQHADELSLAMSDCGEHPSVYYLGRECRRNGGGKMANTFAYHTFHGA
ncbi:hypothetical protein ACIP02_26400 [Pseudomonas sp. NPDC089408]|uniref:hypothetical protein n=1 Tax=Pseudomonas sp. NPDC089408 TaxID=3364465 RepID=UPI0037FD7385